MPAYFSAKNLGFYHSELGVGDCELPADAVELLDEDYRHFMAELSSKPAQLSADDHGRPVLVYRSQTQAKQLVWERIKEERDRRQLEGGAPVDGHWFLSTERATGEYNSLIGASQGQPADTVLRVGWRTMDGAEVDMTPALARRILFAGFAHRCAIDDAAQAHKAAMESSADPASYDFSGGWPESFKE